MSLATAVSNLTVLIVDDEDPVRSVISEMVTALGHTPLPKNGGQAALDELDRGVEVDLVMLDMLMPGMGGEETFRKIRQLRPTIPVVLCSGHLEPDAVDRMKELGLERTLEKPFTFAQLADAVVSTLGDP